MIVDLRSDTVTKPTIGMLDAMKNAKVGDDVFEEDPTVKELEKKVAVLFGKEAGIFCPSGTMANQIAIKLHTIPGQEVICDKLSHVYNYEGGGIAFNSGCSVKLLDGYNGLFTSDMILQHIRPDDVHAPSTALVCVENTCNKGGGACYDIGEVKKISQICRSNKLYLHLDGARIFNALIARREEATDYGKHFDTISICLSKGLGAPVGSVLIGSNENIQRARRIRKVLGGGMRQAGFMAAAGIYALNNHIDRLQKDHQNAKIIEQELSKFPFIKSILNVETNIVVFELIESYPLESFIEKLKQQHILVVPFGKQQIRMVTHLDITDSHMDNLINQLQKIKIQ